MAADCGYVPDWMNGSVLLELGGAVAGRQGLVELIRVSDGAVVRWTVHDGGGEHEVAIRADASDAETTGLQARRVDANGDVSAFSEPVCYTFEGPHGASDTPLAGHEEQEPACASTGRSTLAVWASLLAFGAALRRRPRAR